METKECKDMQGSAREDSFTRMQKNTEKVTIQGRSGENFE